MRSSDGVQLFEDNSVIQREIVEEVIEEALGWHEQDSKKTGRALAPKKHTGFFETLSHKIQVEMDEDREE